MNAATVTAPQVTAASIVAELEEFHACCDTGCKVQVLIAVYRQIQRANASLSADNLRLVSLAASARNAAAVTS